MKQTTIYDTAREAAEKKQRFLGAWKRAVLLAGPHLFGVERADVDTAQDKNELRPDWPLIESAVGPMSRGERVFLIAICGFFNAEWSQEMATANDERVLVPDLASRLDNERRQVVADLLTSYQGW